jgi:hypothetical protein
MIEEDKKLFASIEKNKRLVLEIKLLKEMINKTDENNNFRLACMKERLACMKERLDEMKVRLCEKDTIIKGLEDVKKMLIDDKNNALNEYKESKARLVITIDELEEVIKEKYVELGNEKREHSKIMENMSQSRQNYLNVLRQFEVYYNNYLNSFDSLYEGVVEYLGAKSISCKGRFVKENNVNVSSDKDINTLFKIFKNIDVPRRLKLNFLKDDI